MPRHRTQPSQPSTLQPATPASGNPLSPPRPEAGEHSPARGPLLVSQIGHVALLLSAPPPHATVLANHTLASTPAGRLQASARPASSSRPGGGRPLLGLITECPTSHTVVTANPSGRSRVAVSWPSLTGGLLGGEGGHPHCQVFWTQRGGPRRPESGPVGWLAPSPTKLTHPSPVTVMSIRACRPRLVTASRCPCAPPPHPAVSANTHPGNPPAGHPGYC